MDSDLTSAEPCAARIIRGFFCALRRSVSSDPGQTRGLIASIFNFQLSRLLFMRFALCIVLVPSVSDSAGETALYAILHANTFRIK